jgi:hypothetical protein
MGRVSPAGNELEAHVLGRAQFDGRDFRIAAVLITEQLEWIKAQFRAMGKGRKSGELAFALLSRTQGAAMLARTLGDPSVLKRAVQSLEEWVERVAFPCLN